MKIFLSGGAGFIGSHLLKSFITDDLIEKIVVFDNLSTGFRSNIEQFLNDRKVTFVHGDIRNYSQVFRAMTGCTLVCHQAALGSVPRSIDDPTASNAVNISGHLNVLHAAVELGIKKVVYAASSSTYGDHSGLPKQEHLIGKPLSPYAVTKYVNELYSAVFSETYGIETIGLRYFNVFGPKQTPNGAYAAVIPKFVDSILKNKEITINGNGSHSRDFTYVDNVVHANLLALRSQPSEKLNQIFNIAGGERTDLLELVKLIEYNLDKKATIKFGAPRAGDVAHSHASITKAKKILGYNVEYDVKRGLQLTCRDFKDRDIM